MFGLGPVELLLFIPAFLFVPVVGIYLAFRWLRTQERGPTSGADVAELRERVARLEESLADMDGQLKRLADSQDFTTRLLRDRQADARGDQM
jgi:hypothetical protein